MRDGDIHKPKLSLKKTKEYVQIWQKCICGYAGGVVDDGVDEFVNVCLDFSIAQYMEDCSFWQKKKDFAYLEKKQKNIILQTY